MGNLVQVDKDLGGAKLPMIVTDSNDTERLYLPPESYLVAGKSLQQIVRFHVIAQQQQI